MKLCDGIRLEMRKKKKKRKRLEEKNASYNIVNKQDVAAKCESKVKTSTPVRDEKFNSQFRSVFVSTTLWQWHHTRYDNSIFLLDMENGNPTFISTYFAFSCTLLLSFFHIPYHESEIIRLDWIKLFTRTPIEQRGSCILSIFYFVEKDVLVYIYIYICNIGVHLPFPGEIRNITYNLLA